MLQCGRFWKPRAVTFHKITVEVCFMERETIVKTILYWENILKKQKQGNSLVLVYDGFNGMELLSQMFDCLDRIKCDGENGDWPTLCIFAKI